jgi:GNAT superfamily N-acetyltransferase
VRSGATLRTVPVVRDDAPVGDDEARARAALGPDLDAMVATLVASHLGYAWERWAVPGCAPHDLARLYELDLGAVALPHGAVHLIEDRDGGVASVAAWVPTDVFSRLAEHVLDALDDVALAVIGGRLAIVDEVEQAIRAVRPCADWYLATMGTRPDARGRGLGARVLRPMLDRLDHEHATAVLETSDRRNVGFYRRAGFEVAHHLTALPHGAPPVWAMHRPAR